jgi:hypothetical protein
MTAWFFPAVGNVSIGAQKETAAIPTSLPFFIRKRKKREKRECKENKGSCVPSLAYGIILRHKYVQSVGIL